jgi:hypothetical protein
MMPPPIFSRRIDILHIIYDFRIIDSGHAAAMPRFSMPLLPAAITLRPCRCR